MQTHPAFPKVASVDSWATSWANVVGLLIGEDSAITHETIRGGTFGIPESPGTVLKTDMFRPFRALYFSARTPRATHWPSLARPLGRRLIRKIRNPL